jgi:hypothetical protein
MNAYKIEVRDIPEVVSARNLLCVYISLFSSSLVRKRHGD